MSFCSFVSGTGLNLGKRFILNSILKNLFFIFLYFFVAGAAGSIIQELPNVSPFDCCNICGRLANCLGFNYNKPTATCTLLSNLNLPTVPNDDFDNYIVISRGVRRTIK
jgi:hypothetical protein